MFATKYLSKQNKPPFLSTRPSQHLGIIIVIPCFCEPDIRETLQSLAACTQPKNEVEVIILINHSENAAEEIKSFNNNTKNELDSWIQKNESEGIRYFAVGPVELKKKWAGAGVARKTGMDEALYRFNKVEKPGGIIVSLDADTIVDTNYLLEIENHFKNYPKNVGATISFEHQKENLTGRHLEGIRLYEKYLDYYKRALDFTGYPFAMFTIGSAFAVTAAAYIKRGGMNRRQAGEDFYFLQGLVQIGNVGEIVSTKVYPSARLSNRVPFGTGPILKKWMDGQEDLTKTYNFRAFADLKVFFEKKDLLFKTDKIEFEQLLETLPSAVAEFLVADNFWSELNELNQNCSSLQSFQKRFFQKFNAFKILKFLNATHEQMYRKENIVEQIRRLSSALK